MSMGMDHPLVLDFCSRYILTTGTFETYRCLHSRRTVTLLSPAAINRQQVLSQGWVLGRLISTPSCSMLEFLTGLTLYRPCVDNHSCHEFLSVTATSCFQDSISQPCSPCFSSYNLFTPSSEMISETWGACVDTNVPSMAECSQSLLRTLSSNELTSTHCNKKLFQPRLGMAPIYRCKYKYSEGSWTTWPFRKTTSVGSPQSLWLCQLWVLTLCNI